MLLLQLGLQIAPVVQQANLGLVNRHAIDERCHGSARRNLRTGLGDQLNLICSHYLFQNDAALKVPSCYQILLSPLSPASPRHLWEEWRHGLVA